MTFSICVREPDPTDEGGESEASVDSDGGVDDGGYAEANFGVAVATQAPAVGALCPFVTREGAIATQAFVNVRLGRRGVELLGDMAIEDVLEGLLAEDDDAADRQVHGIDARGRTYGFTGEGTEGWSGHELYPDRGLTTAGNMLMNGPETLETVADAYTEAEGSLAERLVAALEAGVETGGDKRGHSSAALLVSEPEPSGYHDLRIDHAEDPVSELKQVRDAAKAYMDDMESSENGKSRSYQ